METCLICGREYDTMIEPDHDDNCSERLTEEMVYKVKPIPELARILEGLIGEK